MINASVHSPQQMRAIIRAGQWQRPTTGLCLGFVQANLVMLPAADADDFLLFCNRNAQACPILEVTTPGDPSPQYTARGADLRTDVPRYRVFRHGELIDEPTDILAYWRKDLVAFLLGCSFTAEAALLEAGVRLKHLELGLNVPMFVTNVPCQPSERFHGNLVVSMRPLRPEDVPIAERTTSRYPKAHGGPVHVGDPAPLGIQDILRPDYGDPVPVDVDEVPVFWACGVTPQFTALASKTPFMVTHAPGHMFITDLPHKALAID